MHFGMEEGILGEENGLHQKRADGLGLVGLSEKEEQRVAQSSPFGETSVRTISGRLSPRPTPMPTRAERAGHPCPPWPPGPGNPTETVGPALSYILSPGGHQACLPWGF